MLEAIHRGWDMPYPDLLTELLAKTSGRVLRGDAEPGRNPKGEILSKEAEFLDRVTASDLFVEYVVSDFSSKSPSSAR